jgi:hypothetical protein
MSLVEKLKQLAEEKGRKDINSAIIYDRPGIEISTTDTSCIVTSKTKTIRTLDEVLKEANIDTEIWEVERWVANKWDCVAKISRTGEEQRLEATELWQVKVWLRRKSREVCVLESLLKRLEDKSPVALEIPRKTSRKATGRRSLEISIMDPHFGLQCVTPSSDASWGIHSCERIASWAVEECLDSAKPYGPLEEIVFVFGNDFLHADNIQGTTTKGTIQPDAIDYDQMIDRAERLAIRMVEQMKEVAPVKIFVIPGNHAKISELFLGRILRAYYRNDKNVTVDASSSPYKFYHFGVNLIGYEHGHQIKPIRMAALMANECADIWGSTVFRAWHCGDQHRRGSSSPVTFEEQSVSVEYLPGLTPANSWHRSRSLNWQKRAATCFIYDFDRGQLAHMQRNINSYTGRPLGE